MSSEISDDEYKGNEDAYAAKIKVEIVIFNIVV